LAKLAAEKAAEQAQIDKAAAKAEKSK